MFEFFMEYNLISSNQSGYKPGGSCTNQLLFIADEVYKSLDCGYDVRGVFIENPKAVDKIQHNVVVFKSEQNGVSESLRIFLQDYLDERKERIVLIDQVFSWARVTAGVPLDQSLRQCSFYLYYWKPSLPLFKVEITKKGCV